MTDWQIRRIGPFHVRLGTPLAGVRELLDWFYGPAEPDASDQIIQHHIRIEPGPAYRRLFAPQAVFRTESDTPFAPFPASHAFPLFEWGLNWCIAQSAHQYLMLHAGVVERDGNALILPAVPGSGKSTLTAALALRGWRLLSDEFGLLHWESGLLHPIPRPIPLKNRSIPVIRAYSTDAELGPVFAKTRKGDVAHLRPPADCIERQLEPARPAWVVFPRFGNGLGMRLTALEDSVAFARLSQNAFNYRLLGAQGFQALEQLIRSCQCWGAEYGDLDTIVSAIDRLPPPKS